MKYGHVESTYQHGRGAASGLVKLSHEKPPSPSPVQAEIFFEVLNLFPYFVMI